MLEKSFCDIFKELRTEKKLSQDAMATELEVSPALISKWENNQSTPAPEMLEYIADYFDVSVDYLIGRTNDKRWYSKTEKDMTIANNIYRMISEIPKSEQAFILSTIENLISCFHDEEKWNNGYVKPIDYQDK